MSDPRVGDLRWDGYVRDMLAACEKVMSYTDGMDQAAFVADERTYDATLRNLGIIGEAATRIPDSVREAHEEIPWRAMIGTRNRIIHGYLGIDDDVIWSLVRDDIPELIRLLGAFSEETEEGDSARGTGTPMSRERRENDAGNILRNLKQPGGASRTLRQSRVVALLPSVLFDGELPEFIVPSNSDAVLVATDKRMLHVHPSRSRGSVKRVRSFPYEQIRWIKAYGNFIAPPYIKIRTSGKEHKFEINRRMMHPFVDHVWGKLPKIEEPSKPSKRSQGCPKAFGCLLLVILLILVAYMSGLISVPPA